MWTCCLEYSIELRHDVVRKSKRGKEIVRKITGAQAFREELWKRVSIALEPVNDGVSLSRNSWLGEVVQEACGEAASGQWNCCSYSPPGGTSFSCQRNAFACLELRQSSSGYSFYYHIISPPSISPYDFNTPLAHRPINRRIPAVGCASSRATFHVFTKSHYTFFISQYGRSRRLGDAW